MCVCISSYSHWLETTDKNNSESKECTSLSMCHLHCTKKTLIISVNSTKLMFLRQYQMTTALTEFVSTVNGTKTRRS